MNSPRLLPRTIACHCVAAALACAQTSAPPPPTAAADPDTVLLTPFEVSTSRDTGYQATETLAGTRIRTNLADVASAIQVLTKEFMRDIGATDNQTLLQFTTSAEVAGVHSTYAGVGNGTSVDESGNLRAPQSAQRVRGLAARRQRARFVHHRHPLGLLHRGSRRYSARPELHPFRPGQPGGHDQRHDPQRRVSQQRRSRRPHGLVWLDPGLDRHQPATPA